MKIHALDCGTMCPVARRAMHGEGGWFERGHLVCHCWLLEAPQGLVLVDTGIGTQDARLGLPGPFSWVAGPTHNPEGTALAHVRRLGFAPEDVRHIVLTHLDLDHAGGLADFPWATVHLHSTEWAAGQTPTGAEAHRYLSRQWAHGPRWAPADKVSGERWFGFEAVRDLPGLPPEILMVPLFGHSRGHVGVAVHDGSRWRLHGGDAWFHASDLLAPEQTPWGLRLFQRLAAFDNTQRLANLQRLQQLAADPTADVQMVCAHHPGDLALLRDASVA